MAIHGLINTESRYSVHETIDRLEDLLKSKGIKIFARFDQAAEAQAVGLSLRPTRLGTTPARAAFVSRIWSAIFRARHEAAIWGISVVAD